MQKLQQVSRLRCQKHINQSIGFIQVSKKCPYQSRLVCGQCIHEFKCVDNIIDINEFLSTEVLLQSLKDHQVCNQGVLFNLIKSQQQYKKYIDRCIEDLLTKIHEFKLTLMKQLDLHKEYVNLMVQLRIQYDAELTNLKNKFKQVSELDDYHTSKEWIELEECVQQCVSLLYEPENQEIQVTLCSLNASMNARFNTQMVVDFKASLDIPLNKLLQNLPFVKFTETILDNNLFGNELIDRITDKRQKQFKLIFKGQRDGMNAAAFWKHCENKGPTITICKSKSGEIFGGYTPCKWINNSQWQPDPSMTSFVFSFTKQQIYPLKVAQITIFGYTSYGPVFGSDLQIQSDFQSGSSNLDHQYDTSSYQIADKSTHLMGGKTPALRNIEVYVIE